MAQPTTVFIRTTDPSGKNKDVITQHQVWDMGRFLASQTEQYQGEKVKPEDRRTVTVATEEDYRKYKGWKGYSK